MNDNRMQSINLFMICVHIAIASGFSELKQLVYNSSLRVHNKHRRNAGLPELVWNIQLQHTAENYAKLVVDNCGTTYKDERIKHSKRWMDTPNKKVFSSWENMWAMVGEQTIDYLKKKVPGRPDKGWYSEIEKRNFSVSPHWQTDLFMREAV